MKVPPFSALLVGALLPALVLAHPFASEEGPIPGVERLTLVNGQTGNDIFYLGSAKELSLNALPEQLNVRASVYDEFIVASVVYYLNGDPIRVDNEAPFTAFDPGSPWMPEPGDYTLFAEAYTEPEGQGTLLEQVVEVELQVIDGPSVQVNGLYFYNYITGENQWIEDGGTVYLSDLRYGFSPKVSTTPRVIGSVLYNLNGEIILGSYDNSLRLPYDSRLGTDWVPGDYHLEATPFQERGAQGGKGETYKVDFSIVEDRPVGVQAFTLIDSRSDQDLFPIADGEPIFLNEVGEQLNIRADLFPGEVGSVQFRLHYVGANGSDVQLLGPENEAPYAVFADQAGDYHDWTPEPGAYRLVAMPFTGPDGGGAALPEREIRFSIRPEGPATRLLGFTLVNAATDTDIGPLLDGDTLVLAETGAALNIRANTRPAGIGSVLFHLNGQVRGPENVAPYALWADEAGDYREWTPEPGRYRLSATPYALADAAGDHDQALKIDFTVIDRRPEPGIEGFTLVHASSDVDIRPLVDGDTIYGALVGEQLNIRANTRPEEVGSVRFLLNGQVRGPENVAPYALWGDQGGDFHEWEPEPGDYVLKATPYTGPEGTGEAGLSQTLRFTFVPYPRVSELVLIDADTDQEIDALGDDLYRVNMLEHSGLFNVKAETVPVRVGSVAFDLEYNPHRVENEPPYALFGDWPPGDYYGWAPVPGEYYSLVATPYLGPNATGTAGDRHYGSLLFYKQYHFQRVVLVDPATNADVRDLQFGEAADNVVTLSPDLPAINIRLEFAETWEEPAWIDYFLASDEVPYYRYYNYPEERLHRDVPGADHSVYGSISGQYRAWMPPEGEYAVYLFFQKDNVSGYNSQYEPISFPLTIRYAEGYAPPASADATLSMRTEAGSSLETTVEVEGLQLYPNPTAGMVLVRWGQDIDTPVDLQLYGPVGRVLEQWRGQRGGQFELDLSAYGPDTGLFLLEMRRGEQRWVRRVLKRR